MATIINGGASSTPTTAGPSTIVSVSDGALDANLKSLTVNIVPKQSGSGDPSPSNVRAITGTTEAKVVRAGKNLCPKLSAVSNHGMTLSVASNGVVTLTGQSDTTNQTFGWVDFTLPAGTYIASGGNANYTLRIFNSTNNSTLAIVDSESAEKTFTLTEPKAVAAFIRADSAVALSAPLTYYPMIRLSSESGGYEPYDGQSTTISLGRTVYGGTLDVTTGALTVDKKMTTFSGTTPSDVTSVAWNTTYGGVQVRDTSISTVNAPNKDFISNVLVGATARGSAATGGIKTYQGDTGNNVTYYFLCGTWTSLAEFNTFCQTTPLQIVVPLATPQTYTLTATQVATLLGENHIWSDAGEVTIEYYTAMASIVAVQNRSTKAYVTIPVNKIAYETYSITPNQMLDLDSYRSESGVLLRTVLSHTASKIEFNTPHITNDSWQEVWNIIQDGFISAAERSVKIKYYDPDSNSYKTAKCYVPDIQYTIRNLDEVAGIINYDPIRVAFIEY